MYRIDSSVEVSSDKFVHDTAVLYGKIKILKVHLYFRML